MKIGGDKVTRFFSFLLYHDDSDFAEVFKEADKPSDLKSLVFPIEGKGDLLVGRADGRESDYFGSFPVDEES
jgi:hypothetical protein